MVRVIAYNKRGEIGIEACVTDGEGVSGDYVPVVAGVVGVTIEAKW